jgi:hypothetical protein
LLIRGYLKMINSIPTEVAASKGAKEPGTSRSAPASSIKLSVRGIDFHVRIG